MSAHLFIVANESCVFVAAGFLLVGKVARLSTRVKIVLNHVVLRSAYAWPWAARVKLSAQNTRSNPSHVHSTGSCIVLNTVLLRNSAGQITTIKHATCRRAGPQSNTK